MRPLREDSQLFPNSSSSVKDENSIVLLGAGLGGMITALSLAAKKIPSKIIERSILTKESFKKDLRTTAIAKRSEEVLKEFGIWELIKDIATPIKTINVIDNFDEGSVVAFSADMVLEDALGYMIYNPEFKERLFEAIKQNEYIELLQGFEYEDVEIEDIGSKVFLKNGEVIETDILIISDGKFSSAKKKFFKDQFNKTYFQKAITFTIKHELDHHNSATELFLPVGPFAILPQKGNNSSIVWSLESELADLLLALPKKEFKARIAIMMKDCLGDFEITSEIGCYPLSASITEQYIYKSAFVFADSAHTIHPLAGQGLNLGIQDIKAFLNVLDEFRYLGLPTMELLTEQFNKARKFKNLQMFFITDSLNQIFSNYSDTLRKLRYSGLKFIENSPKIKEYLIKYAMGK